MHWGADVRRIASHEIRPSGGAVVGALVGLFVLKPDQTAGELVDAVRTDWAGFWEFLVPEDVENNALGVLVEVGPVSKWYMLPVGGRE